MKRSRLPWSGLIASVLAQVPPSGNEHERTIQFMGGVDSRQLRPRGPAVVRRKSHCIVSFGLHDGAAVLVDRNKWPGQRTRGCTMKSNIAHSTAEVRAA